MPQLFQVLRCYKCLVFQIHQTKKSNKFECKMCGEKQSIKRHYGVGTGKDCRLHVQRLNGIQVEKDDQGGNYTDGEEIENKHEDITPHVNTTQPSSSKWSEYVETKEIAEQIVTETMYLDNTEVVLEVPKKRAKTLGKKCNFKCNTSKNLHTAMVTKCEPVIAAKKTLDDTDYISTSTNSNNNVTNSFTNIKVHNISTSITGNAIEEKVPICKKEENIIPSVPNKFVPPKVNANSKWAQFVDLHEENDNSEEVRSDVSKPESTGLFTLSDDADIDDILNF